MRVAVIGGGPSGLVTLKYLIQASASISCEPVEAILFEYQTQVGGTFAARSYEDAELVSSKQLTTFSDFRHSEHGDFLSTQQYVQYLQAYCTHFKLWPHMRLNTRVLSVTRGVDGSHIITYKTNESRFPCEWRCDAVAVCSGLHVTPNIPNIKGMENVPLAFHSSSFKSRKQFGTDKTVMVVGSGETGADIAYLAATSPTKRVLLCHRDGVHFAPKRNPGPVLFPILGRKSDLKEPGIPIDVSRANMFDTTYVHPLLRNSMVLWHYYHWYIKFILWLSSGTTAGMDQWIGRISPERHHPSKIFFNKSMKVCPYISLPYRPSMPGPRLWLYALRSAIVQTPVPDTNGRKVDLAPWPKEIGRDGTVHFFDNQQPEFSRLKGETIKPDIVILSTGYKQDFPFLESSRTKPTRAYGTANQANIRGIWRHDEPTVGFIGFVRPSLGAIPPLAEMQAQLWILNILAPEKIPHPLRATDEEHYRLKLPPDSRIEYGVDHESYVYQLALDMNSAIGLWDVLAIAQKKDVRDGWRLLVVWAFGAHFNTKFRLLGPWQWSGAADMLISEEFWQTITRRPLFFGKSAC
ncbi:Flavin monooxygenase FMO [Fusarium oxysporum f. sp. vasinfectum]|nr:Flavin monooxygenase FMO [Fusarium oxysporum f. sp. vasinfectum]KAK2922594.1 Flavin monooxygenase FMO [Fusarium oxysporum f. sp. vasinfectum]